MNLHQNLVRPRVDLRPEKRQNVERFLPLSITALTAKRNLDIPLRIGLPHSPGHQINDVIRHLTCRNARAASLHGKKASFEESEPRARWIRLASNGRQVRAIRQPK